MRLLLGGSPAQSHNDYVKQCMVTALHLDRNALPCIVASQACTRLTDLMAAPWNHTLCYVH